jgi:hypothetical protein
MTRLTLLGWAAIAFAAAACQSTSRTDVPATTGASVNRGDAGTIDYSTGEPTPQSLTAPQPENR